MGLLDGKIALVTGAGGGIGKEEALALAKEGASLVVNDLGGAVDGSGAGKKMADVVVEEIIANGGNAIANYESVATMAGGQAMVKAALDKYGKLDILINNAGILRDKTLVNMTEAEWDEVIAVHLKGTFSVSQAAVMHMKPRGEGGRIINTSSSSGLLGNFGQSNYGAAKAGIFGFTRVLSIELKKYGITVNAISPGALTRMTENLNRKGKAPRTESEEAAGHPKHIAPVAVFLASDLAKDITGKVFGVSGLKVNEYKMIRNKGAEKQSGHWTAREIADQISEIISQ